MDQHTSSPTDRVNTDKKGAPLRQTEFKNGSKSTIEELISTLRSLPIDKQKKNIPKDLKQRIDQFFTDVKPLDKNSTILTHELYPYFLYESLVRVYNDDDKTPLIVEKILEAGRGSCPYEKFASVYYGEKSKKATTKSEFYDYLKKISEFRSDRYKQDAITSFLDAIPENLRENLREDIIPIVQDFPRLFKTYNWLKLEYDDAQGRTFDMAKGDGDPLAIVKLQARRHLCPQAQQSLESILSKRKDITVPAAKEAAEATGQCFRQKGDMARIRFWQEISDVFEKTFALKGWATTTLRLGYLYWSADDYNQATATFSQLLSKINLDQDKEEAGRALFAIARMSESQQDLESAEQIYQSYLDSYPQGEDIDEVLMSYVLLLVSLKKIEVAIKSLNHIIDIQSEKSFDKRSVSLMSFALFWSGRMYQTLGQKDEANSRWKRLASEYYSTFYGALAHYALESINKTKYVLFPSRNVGFDAKQFFRVLDENDYNRAEKAQALLRLGMIEEAACEVDSIRIDATKPEQVAAKALLLHAAGRWLAAVKLFDALPRSFRNFLPNGFERILFPRSHIKTIETFAAKQKVDPDLVFALVRQESVYYPQARSPVGAMGLMQLMPPTARLELSKTKKDYLTNDLKPFANVLPKDISVLLQPEFNLALGIHHLRRLLDFEKFNGNPIFALAGYNANPTAAIKWMDKIGTHDLLMFIERIPYRETRAYVKLILRNYFYYKRWYRGYNDKLEYLDLFGKGLVSIPLDAPPAHDAAESKENTEDKKPT